MKELQGFYDFIENTPPYEEVTVSGIFSSAAIVQRHKRSASGICETYFFTPLSQSLTPRLYCDDICSSYQNFSLVHSPNLHIDHNGNSIIHLIFRCKNCEITMKNFSLRFDTKISNDELVDNKTLMKVQKIGQFPRFGKPAPKQISKLIGAERDLFFKGTICENMAMGIAAFSYYRRVIDSRKDSIFDRIIRVLELKREENKDLIQELTDAKKETQFTKAVDRIKHALPEGLSINGQNPLTLLYSALSEGLHVKTDEECLHYAQSIKLVLFEFINRLDLMLSEDKELFDAVKLLTKKS
ncbi:hypothetical protein L5M18_08740 [Shewanella sp. SM20]|uniref:hypothetical protein n=1 Tax=Shewanella sp. SM20 TaxID=2912792 RepID=UPI0021D85F42|nr:hypothetical protein [Shewanella sp. SM20]MCU8091649.1 hypothetical protein [Shewanella sp. SM20]